MKHSLTLAVTATIVVMLCAVASAVEVTVNTDTELCDNSGTLICEVAAGSRFKAERVHEGSVYGFLPTRTGGSQGWIPLQALELNDDARRKLGLPTTGKQTRDAEQGEAVLLRYKPEPGQLMVYEADSKMEVTASAKTENAVLDMESTDVAHSQLTMRCTKRDDDGTSTIEVCFRTIELRRDTRQNENTLQFIADGTKATLHRNDSLIYSGKWGAHQLEGLPNLSKLVASAVTVRVDERGEALDESGLEALRTAAGVNPIFASTAYLTLPEQPVRKGGKWIEDVGEPASGPSDKAETPPATGKLKHTVLERVTHQDRRCLRVHFEGTLTQPNPQMGGQITTSMAGNYIIDEETGIVRELNMMASATTRGVIQNIPIVSKSVATVNMRYTGDTLD